MSNKPFEIQSPTLSLNGVNIDTSAQGTLVVPGITRAGSSVAIEVEDTGDQTSTWGSNTDPSTITVIDGYQFAVLNGDVQGPIVGWTAATYAIDAIDGEGYIDGITVVDGGANYTGEAVTYSQRMLATNYADPVNNFNPGDWNWIPFRVRCGAGEITSEFGGGSGNTGDVLFDGNTIYTENTDTDITIQAEHGVNSLSTTYAQLNYSSTNEANSSNGKSSYVWVQDNGVHVQNFADPDNGNYTNTWDFNTDGTISFPDGSIQTTAYAGGGNGSGNGTGWGLQYGNNTTADPGTNSGQTFNSVHVDTAGNTYYFGGSIYEVSGDYVPLIVKVSPTGSVLWSTSITSFIGTAIGGTVVNGEGSYLNVYVEDDTDNVTTNVVHIGMDITDGTVFGGAVWAPTNNAGIGIDLQKTWKFDNNGATLAVGFAGFTTGENRVITLTGLIDPSFGSFTIPKANVPGLSLNNYSFCYIDSTISIYSVTDQGDNWYIDTDDSTDYTTGTHTIQIPQNSNALVGAMSMGPGSIVSVGKPGESYEEYRSTVFDPVNSAIYAVGDSNGHSIVSRFNPDMTVVWHKDINDVETQMYLSDVVVDSAGAIYTVGDNDGSRAYITKLSSDGAIVWRQVMDDNGQPYGMNSLNIAINAADEIVVAAGYYGSEHSQQSDIWVAKFDTEGIMLWQRSVGTSRNDYKGSSYSFNDCQGFLTADDTSFYLSLNIMYGGGPANASAVKLPLDGGDIGVWGSGDNIWTYREETWPMTTVTITTGSVAITDLVVTEFLYTESSTGLDTDTTIFTSQTTQFGAAAVDRLSAGAQTLRLNIDGTVEFPDGTIQYTAYPGSPPVSPILDNSDSNYTSNDSYNSLFFEASPYTVIVLSVSHETGRFEMAPMTASKVTEVSGLGLDWVKRSAYDDPKSNVHQRAEVWYAINNTNQVVSGSVEVYYDNQFDDQTMIVSSWSGCNLDSPWTVSGPTFSNSINGVGKMTGQMTTNEQFTTGLAFFAISNPGLNDDEVDPGYAEGWNQVERSNNGNGSMWEYAYLSYKQFTTPQFNLRVTSTGGPDLTTLQSQGATAIFDALVGFGGGVNKLQNGTYSVTLENNGNLMLADGKTFIGRVNDDDVVVWTDETAEYVGVWYGGDRDVNSDDYGPEASFTIGQEPNDDMYFGPGTGGTVNREWDFGYQANLDLQRMNWHFDGATGDLTLPQEQIGGSINVKSIYYANTWFNSAVAGQNNRLFAVGGEQSTNEYFIAAYDNIIGLVWRKNFNGVDLNDGAGQNPPVAINIQYDNDGNQVFVGYNEGNSTGVMMIDGNSASLNDSWSISPPNDNSGTVYQNAFALRGQSPVIAGHTSGGQVENDNVPGTRGVDADNNPYIEVSRSALTNLLGTSYYNTGPWGIQTRDEAWNEPDQLDEYWAVSALPVSGTGGVKTAVKTTDYTAYGISGANGYLEINAANWPGDPTKLNAFLALSNTVFTAITGTLTPGSGQTISTFNGSGSWYEYDTNLWHMDGNWTVVTGVDPNIWMITNEILSLSYGSWLTANVATGTGLDGSVYYDYVQINNPGTDYQDGDVIRIKGSQLGGDDSTRIGTYNIVNVVDNVWYFDRSTYTDSFVQENDFAFFPSTNASGTVTSVVESIDTNRWIVTINITHGVRPVSPGQGEAILFSDGNDIQATVNISGNSLDNRIGVPAANTYRFVLSSQIQGNITTRSAGGDYAPGDYRVYSDGTTSYLALTSDSVDPLGLKNIIIGGVDVTVVDSVGTGSQSVILLGSYIPIPNTTYYGWALDYNIGGAGGDYDANSLTVFNGTFNIRRSESQQGFIWTSDWHKSFGGLDDDEYFTDVVYDSVTDTVYAVGYFYDINTNVNGLVMALDSTTGDIKWQKFVGCSNDGYGYGNSIKADSKGNVIIIGENDGGYALVTKLNGSNGELIWQRLDVAQSNWNQSPMGVVDYNGDVYVGGTYYHYGLDQDVLGITKLNGATGQQMWVKTVHDVYGDGMNDMWDTFCQPMTFSNELVTWGGNAWNSDLNEWVAVAVSIPMDGSRLGVYGSYEYIDGGLSDYVSNNNTAIVIDPTTPFTSTDGLVISSNSPYINFNDNNDSFFERYDLTTGLPGIVFGDGSEIAHPGIGRFAVDNGDNSRTLEAGMNGKFIYFNDNPSNNSSWIYVPANIDVPLPIGFTVTVVMGDFNSTSKVFVNNNGNGAVSFYVSGSSNFGQQSWSFGGDGKAGVYTIMKVDTDKWMLAGPNVQVD